MSLQSINDAITNGTNVILGNINTIFTQVQPAIDTSTAILTEVNAEILNFTNQANGIITKVNNLLDRLNPILNDFQKLQTSVNHIVSLLFVIMICILVMIFIYFTFWFFRGPYRILAGHIPRPRSFDELVRELTVSRAN